MTQQELVSLLFGLRQIDDPDNHGVFWHNLSRSTEEIEIELEANSFVIRQGSRGVRLCQPCGFIMIEIFDSASSWRKQIDRARQTTAWELLKSTLNRLRAEKPATDSVEHPILAPCEKPPSLTLR